MTNEVSQTKKTTFDGTRGIPAKHQLNLPSIYQKYLGQKVWDFRSPKSWHIDTILKLVWSPEKQHTTYKTGVFVLTSILKMKSITRTQIRQNVTDNGFSWVTTRNIILPRLKLLGMIKESRIYRDITPNSEFSYFFLKFAHEWKRELADYSETNNKSYRAADI